MTDNERLNAERFNAKLDLIIKQLDYLTTKVSNLEKDNISIDDLKKIIVNASKDHSLLPETKDHTTRFDHYGQLKNNSTKSPTTTTTSFNNCPQSLNYILKNRRGSVCDIILF
jgi:glutamate mutase epsilon subunit